MAGGWRAAAGGLAVAGTIFGPGLIRSNGTLSGLAVAPDGNGVDFVDDGRVRRRRARPRLPYPSFQTASRTVGTGAVAGPGRSVGPLGWALHGRLGGGGLAPWIRAWDT